MPENPPNISARIIADSVNPAGVRITSWILRYPRFIHSEFMTHRCFSRNAASSRAIPLAKMIEAVRKDPATPEYWATQKSGMQGGPEHAQSGLCEHVWLEARDKAVDAVDVFGDLMVHKSIANRLLEPFAHMTVLATATNHENFFALRAHPAAQPEFQVLAYRMLAEYLRSKPCETEWGQWHIPGFGTRLSYIGDRMANLEEILKISTARCARLSYLTQDGEHSPEKDIALHDRLLADGHLSPFEHCAQAMEFKNTPLFYRSNFDTGVGASHWLQYRKKPKIAAHEKNIGADLAKIMATKPEWITL